VNDWYNNGEPTIGETIGDTIEKIIWGLITFIILSSAGLFCVALFLKVLKWVIE
jgi:hypothetical protein